MTDTANTGHGGSSDQGGGRRDFLYLATGTTGAIGAAAFVWPVIDSMNPADDVLALRVHAPRLHPAGQRAQ